MSQVIFSSKIIKAQAGAKTPQQETEEEKKRREAAEAAAAQQKAADNTGQAATEQIADSAQGQATSSAQQTTQQAAAQQTAGAQQTPKREGVAVPKVEQNTGYLDFNGIRLTGNNALAQIQSRFSGYENLGAQDVLNRVISSGGHVDVSGNKIYFYDKDGNELDSKTVGIDLPQSRFAKNWAATFHTKKDADLDSWNHFIRGNYIADVTNYKPVKTDLARGSGWFYKVKGADGKDTYDTNAIQNQEMFNLMRDVWGQLHDEDFDNKYNVGKYDRNAMLRLDNEIEAAGGIDKYIDGLKQRAATYFSGNSQLTDSDIDFIKMYGFSPDAVASAGGETGAEDSGGTEEYITPDDLKGNAAALQRAGIKFTKNDDGTWSVSGGDFGDASENWSLNDYDDLFGGTKYQNGFLLNGHLYSYDDAAKDYASTINNYVMAGQSSHNWNERYNNMNASGIRFRGDRRYAGQGDDYYGAYAMYDPNTTYASDIDSFIRENNLGGTGVRDVSADFTSDTGGTLPDGSVYALTVPGQSDKYGRPIIKYIERDANGKFVDATNKYAAKTPAKFSRYNQNLNWGTRDNSGYAVYGTFKSAENGATQNNALLYNPDTGDYMLKTKYDPSTGTSGGIRVDASKVAEIIKYIQNKGVWNISNDNLSRTNWSTTQNADSQSSTHEQIAQKAGIGPNKEMRTYSQDEYRRYAQAKQALHLKSGGKIDWNRLQKLQIGGSVAKAGQQVNLATTEEAAHDISKAHTWDEGLTHSEKLRVSAALGDLVSMATAFVPGISAVSAATGFGSSVAQLVADREAQAEGRDVGNYGLRFVGNTIMDALTLAPVAGGFAKMAKSVRGIKKIAPVLGKLIRAAAPVLGAAGVANASTALEKIVSGNIKEMTSNDWVDLLNGVSAATGGTAVIGQTAKKARAITQLTEGGAKQALKQELKFNLDPNVKFAGKDGQMTVGDMIDTLSDVKTEKEAAAKIKETLSSQNSGIADDVLEKSTKSILEKLDLKTSKGRLGWGNGNGHFYTLGLSRGDTRIDVNSGGLKQKETSFWNEFLNPKRVWKQDENLAKAVKNLSAEEINAANKAVKTRTYNPDDIDMSLNDWLNARAKAQAISGMTAANPQAFENAIFEVNGKETPVNSLNRFTFGGRRQYRTALPAQPNNPTPTTTPATTPTPTPRQPRNPRPVVTGATPNDYTRPDITWSPRFTKNKINDADLQAILDMIKGYRDASNKIKRDDYSALVDMINGVGKYIPKSKQNIITKELGKLDVLKQGGYIPKASGGIQIDPNGKGWKVNKAGLMDLASAITKDIAIQKSYDDQRKAALESKKILATSPRVQGERFDVSPIMRAGEMAKDPYRQLQFNNSDARLNMAGELQRAEKISDIEDTVGQKVTSAIDKYNSNETRRINAQAAQDAKVADANRAQIASANAQLHQLDAAERSERFANVWNTYDQQVRQEVRDRRNKLAQLALEDKNRELQNAFDQQKEFALTALKQEYAADTNENKGSFENWLQITPGKNQAYIEAMNSEAMKKAKEQYYNELARARAELIPRAELIYQKSGGKTVTKKQAVSAQEKMAIQGDAYAKRAVLQTNASLDRMLQKLLK